jgi:serine protease Do
MKRFLLILLLIPFLSNAQEKSVAELFEEVHESVVIIATKEDVMDARVPGMRETAQGLGSGVIIDKNLIFTAAHVVQSAKEIMVIFTDGERVPGKVIRSSQGADVALVQLMWEKEDAVIATVGNSDAVRTGEHIFIIGAPYGLDQSLSVGYISGRHAVQNLVNGSTKIEFFQTDAAINTGNSGGPMFNMQGEVVGVCSYILTESGGFQGLGFVATTNLAKSLLLEESYGWIGMESKLIGKEICQVLNVPQEGAVLVEKVVLNSPAGKAGLRGGFIPISFMDYPFMLGGDVILEVEGIKVHDEESLDQMREKLLQMDTSQGVIVKILREGQVKSIVLKF